MLRLLKSRPLVLVGTFSYSLYLIHAPALWVLFPVIHTLRLSDNAAFLFRLAVGTPFALLLAYLFFLIVERPFLIGRRPSVQA
jgi:peptidoglycan/LPS O-acetylase OafA/YrhL